MKRLHFVDIDGCKILSFDPATGVCNEAPIGEKVGCVVPYQQGRVLAAGVEKVYEVDLTAEDPAERKRPTHMAILPDADCESLAVGPGETALHAPKGFRFNDGKCDPQGRLWVGSMNSDWRNPEARKGKLYCMAPPKERPPPGTCTYTMRSKRSRPCFAELRRAAEQEWEAEEDLDGVLHQYGPNAILREKIAPTTLSNGD